MSNAADDRCAREGCGVERRYHASTWSRHHAFVEPAPQPAPSGDEAKVREIAGRHWAPADWKAPVGDEAWEALKSAVREALVDGKADGAREEREKLAVGFRAIGDRLYAMMEKEPLGSRKRRDLSLRSSENFGAADCIARRGSEGT